MMAMMAGLSKMMAPAMLGMAVGSMVGQLATRAFGTHDLPIPRQPATVTLVPSNIDGFAAERSIPTDEMRLWVLAHELAGHALFTADHVRDTLSDLVRQHVGGFRPDPNAVADRLGSLDSEAGDPLAALQQALGDPEVLLGAVTSPEQLALRPRLDALVAVVVGYTDWIVDAVVGAADRRQGAATSPTRSASGGWSARPATRSSSSCSASASARSRSPAARRSSRASSTAPATAGWPRCSSGPTPSRRPTEVDAPGLWLARIGHADADSRTGSAAGQRRGSAAARVAGGGERAAASTSGCRRRSWRRRRRTSARRRGTRPSRGSR